MCVEQRSNVYHIYQHIILIWIIVAAWHHKAPWIFVNNSSVNEDI